MSALPENMRKAAQNGFINATDLADYLTGKGLPFRSAYKISGQLVARCIKDGTVLEELPIETFREYTNKADDDIYNAINLDNCVKRRTSEGGTSVESVEKQIRYVRDSL